MLFAECVHAPILFPRGKLAQAVVKNAAKWAGKVRGVVESRIGAFYSIADLAAARMVSLTKDHAASERLLCFTSATKSALMCISDCERYLEDYSRARAAADFVRCMSPEDPKAHAKLALLGWKGTGAPGGDNLRAMHHFCFELANDPPPALHGDALVSRFVAHVNEERARAGPTSTRAKSVKYQFSCAFINLAWSLLVDGNFGRVERGIRDECGSLWGSLERCLQQPSGHADHLCEADLVHVVGIAMYVRHRLSPQGDPDDRLHPHRARLADRMICCLMVRLCKKVESNMQALADAMRARRKNRQRSMQKKRRARTSAPAAPAGAAGAHIPAASAPAGLELFASVHGKADYSHPLGALSFLAHFWSKSLVITPDCALAPFKDVLDRVGNICASMDRIAEPAGITGIFAQVDTSVMSAAVPIAGSLGALPPLLEDIEFAAFRPCKVREMFRRVRLTKLFIQHLLPGREDGAVARALHALAGSSYSAHVEPTAVKHLDAFSQRVVKLSVTRAGGCAGGVGSEAVRGLVRLALRKQRLLRVRRRLAEHASGRIVRYRQPRPADVVENRGCTPSPRPDVAQPGPAAAGKNVAREEDGAGASLPPHKRRRLAAALSQLPAAAPAAAGDAGRTPDTPVAPTPIAASAAAGAAVTTPAAPCDARSPACMLPPGAPARSTAVDTPVTLGQRPPRLGGSPSQETITPLV
jgi:hypothetical protein